MPIIVLGGPHLPTPPAAQFPGDAATDPPEPHLLQDTAVEVCPSAEAAQASQAEGIADLLEPKKNG